ncbi:MAG TPA: ABC transporter permease [Polyangiaceae bacterium]|jgi:phospholipid/cholesterol/gamma-HCH transport system permease protein|nr:ABC transporter permease [Polyangiaceae bacterium]
MTDREPPPSLDEMLGLEAGPSFDVLATPREFFGSVRELARVARRTVHFTLRGERRPFAVANQMYEIGYRSAAFLCISMAFIGMIFVYQAGLQIRRLIPDTSQLGATFLELLVRDLAASISALLLATRVGAGIAAEIGSMVVTEQLDALRMCAADPIDYLVRPRFVASLAMTVVLTVIAGCVAFLSGMWTAYAFFSMNPRTFADASLVDFGDVAIGLTKCIAYGAAIPIISAYSGLVTRGGSEGVGQATTRAVVMSSLAVIVLNFAISTVGYVLLG